MTFRVIWDEVALLELDRIWLAADDQEWIENLAIRINTELTHNALEAGESACGKRSGSVQVPVSRLVSGD